MAGLSTLGHRVCQGCSPDFGGRVATRGTSAAYPDPRNPACGPEPRIGLLGLHTRHASRAATRPPKWGAGRVERGGRGVSSSATNAPRTGGRVATRGTSAAYRDLVTRLVVRNHGSACGVSIRGSLREQLPFETASFLGLLTASLDHRGRLAEGASTLHDGSIQVALTVLKRRV
jgi:hypothetical protein